MRTTAEYRKLAKRAEEDGKFRIAAGYYRLAIHHYPESQKCGASGEADLEYLRRKLMYTRRLAE